MTDLCPFLLVKKTGKSIFNCSQFSLCQPPNLPRIQQQTSSQSQINGLCCKLQTIITILLKTVKLSLYNFPAFIISVITGTLNAFKISVSTVKIWLCSLPKILLFFMRIGCNCSYLCIYGYICAYLCSLLLSRKSTSCLDPDHGLCSYVLEWYTIWHTEIMCFEVCHSRPWVSNSRIVVKDLSCSKKIKALAICESDAQSMYTREWAVRDWRNGDCKGTCQQDSKKK